MTTLLSGSVKGLPLLGIVAAVLLALAGLSCGIPGPDLVVDTPTVSGENLAAGDSFTLRARVNNQGQSPSAPTMLRYYLSHDPTLTTGRTEVGAISVSGLDDSEGSVESITLTAPYEPGTYYYGACVDPPSEESDTANNCSDAVAVAVKLAVGFAPYPGHLEDDEITSGANPTGSCIFNTRSAEPHRSGDHVLAQGWWIIGPNSRCPVARVNVVLYGWWCDVEACGWREIAEGSSVVRPAEASDEVVTAQSICTSDGTTGMRSVVDVDLLNMEDTGETSATTANVNCRPPDPR